MTLTVCRSAGNGEWIWRPLNNPKHLAAAFAMENPQVLVCCSVAVSSRVLKIDDRYDLRPRLDHTERRLG
jgi:glucans biosynthesis protein